ncbi:MAG: SMC-Scp complex subunit ScpB [Candidatus Aenigmatarchaeota archaeon]|nr:SMC-Scp complex subunit ScpB [Candidatus Aenigmarchaeota archaeon]
MRNRKAMIEATLFMATKNLTAEEIAKILKIQPEEVKQVVNEMKKELESEDRGIYLLETNTGYRLFVKPEYIKYVKNLASYQDLSRGLLRVLALVAYKQPITQSEIVKVIGNRTYEYVKELEKRGLITTVKSGRTKALVATKEFAEYFGIQNPEDAKKLFESLKGENIEKGNDSA